MTAFILLNFAVFIFAAGMLNPLCLWLSPIAIALICSYSYTKRFTWLCHLYLGFTIASAPVGAWFAVTGKLALTPFLLGLVVMLWIAGFDIIYATQDIEFDRKTDCGPCRVCSAMRMRCSSPARSIRSCWRCCSPSSSSGAGLALLDGHRDLRRAAGGRAPHRPAEQPEADERGLLQLESGHQHADPVLYDG